MLNKVIKDDELLYRAVPNKPQMWKDGRPSSAIFKDSKGVSVDRGGGRKEKNIVQSFESRFDNLKAVVSISAGDCRAKNTYVEYDPIEENIYHSLVLDSKENVTIKKSKARQLTRGVKIVHP